MVPMKSAGHLRPPAFVGQGVLSPLPGLDIHGEMEPSAHALGYRLTALRVLGLGLEQGWWSGFVSLVSFMGGNIHPGTPTELRSPRMLQPLRGCFRFPREPGVRFATPGYPLKSLRDRP
jgi:hypothetical protein